jgi:hypothetical protein
MTIPRTIEEIENKIDELSYVDYCDALSGQSGVSNTSQLYVILDARTTNAGLSRNL